MVSKVLLMGIFNSTMYEKIHVYAKISISIEGKKQIYFYKKCVIVTLLKNRKNIKTSKKM